MTDMPVLRLLLVLLLLVLLGGGALIGALWWGQERLLFFPEPLPADHRFRFGADVHETWVEVPGARLHALHLRVERPRALVFYLHGNAGNLEGWFTNADFWRAQQVDLFMPDYRGYGKSTGRIAGEAQLHADVDALWASLAARRAGLPVIVVGRSLGTGLATALAARLPEAERPELLLLVSPYLSVQRMAAELYAWLPESLAAALLRYPLRSDRSVAALPAGRPRLVVVHGAQDELIPAAHGEALAGLRPGSVFTPIPGAGHNDLQDRPAYRAAVVAAVDAAVARH